MNKVECLRSDGWGKSIFTEQDLLEGIKECPSGWLCAYRIVDDKGNVLRLFNLERGKLVEDTTAKVEPNMEHKGYYYNPVAVPWHEAVEDIIKNYAVYLCKYTNESNFVISYDSSGESKLKTSKGISFVIEPELFTAKWHKEVGKVQPKPKYSIPDGVYYTLFKEDAPLTAELWCTRTPASGWITAKLPLEGVIQGKHDTYRGKFAYVKDGVVSKEFTVKG